MRPEASLARPFLGPNDITRDTRDRIDILSQEVATGRSSDVGRALRSDFSELSRLTHDLQRMDAVAHGLSRAASWGDGLQTALGGIEGALSNLTEGLAVGLSSATRDGLVPDMAQGALRDIAALLNGTSSERALFANGAASGPLGDVDAVLSDIRGMAAAAADYATYASDVDAYFAPGGVFETTRLTIGAPDPVRFPAGDGRTVAFAYDATDEAIMGAVAQVALAAGLSGAAFDIPAGSDAALDIQGRTAIAAGGIPALRGRIGAVEQRIGDLMTALTDDRATTEMALGEMTGIDRYEAASGLQNEMSRLEALYAITARRAQLRLTDYL